MVASHHQAIARRSYLAARARARPAPCPPAPATPQVQAAFRNLAIAFIHHWRGHQVTAAREYDASHPAALLRQLGISPSRR